MMQNLSTTAKAIAAAVGMVVFIASLYGGYWVGKYAAYQLFYQEHVRATVREMVRADALKESL